MRSVWNAHTRPFTVVRETKLVCRDRLARRGFEAINRAMAGYMGG
jgi:hypothetical protein